MRLTYLLTLITFIAASCNQDAANNKGETIQTVSKKEQKDAGGDVNNSSDSPGRERIPTASDGFWEKMRMNEMRDQNGMVAATIPFPASWKIIQGDGKGKPSITGPNGIKVTDFPLQSFMNNYNQSLQQTYIQSGQQMRAMPGVEQLIQQDFVPWAANQGLAFVRYYEIPEISLIDRWYSEQLYKALPSRAEIAVIGTEWKSNEGKPYFLLVHLNVSTSEAMQNWYYIASGLEAEPAYFDAAKKQYIFGLANTRYNLEPIMAYNQQEAQSAGRSWAAHNQRMAQNRANFEASQRAFVNKSNAINDAMMSGWRERNATSDRQQERIIDGIHERSNVQDPSTGEKYKVDAGSNQYWMNSNGEYIGTKLNDYDPNLDVNMNGQKWKELKEIKQ